MDFGGDGPEDRDWRVPISELEARRERLSEALLGLDVECVIIEDPVELYWLTGGRQNGMLVIGAKDSEVETTHWVRKSLSRAKWESGGSDSPNVVSSQPRSSDMEEALRKIGVSEMPGMLCNTLPASRRDFLSTRLSGFSDPVRDVSGLIHGLRETKSDWEISMMEESGRINERMFRGILEEGGSGMSELEIASIAEKVSRIDGFGGRIRMRRWPMDCDRAVVVSGRSGGIPSFFDSAVGGSGSSPTSPLGAGHRKIRDGEPVLVDLVHVHRGYVSDCTRMFSSGAMSKEWAQRLEDMAQISDLVVSKLGAGGSCSEAWYEGKSLSAELGYDHHLMGMPPHQARFLGHSVGLELDESPVVAGGFDRPMHTGCTMAIEPKVVFGDGAIGIEDTWVATKDGLKCLTGGTGLPPHMEW
tara:strand:- start:33402 stop:34646 length:1245 start_codon:yes stop_codon:yes gene_type:complete